MVDHTCGALVPEYRKDFALFFMQQDIKFPVGLTLTSHKLRDHAY